jgi:endogenous inhibitor of DNA gyrase (YacG/DUF329 family)
MKPHGNSKFTYPFPKVCTVCGTTWLAKDRYQARGGKTCGPACKAKAIAAGHQGKRTSPPVHCKICDKPFWPRNRTATRQFCSRRCYGAWRASEPAILEHMAKIAPLGTQARTPESFAQAANKMRGPNNPAWKGGVTYRSRKGNYQSPRYVRCPPEYLPMARGDGYIMEHRLVAAQAIGRLLTRVETVHHLNHDNRDNRVENLALFASNKDHKLFEAHGAPLPVWSGCPTQAVCGASACPPGPL